MLFAEASVDQAAIICDCLRRFCVASGQKVSHHKSRIYFSNNVEMENKTAVCEALNMDMTDDLGTYLGMPTIFSRVTRETFKHLCEKIDRKIGWIENQIFVFSKAYDTSQIHYVLDEILLNANGQNTAYDL